MRHRLSRIGRPIVLLALALAPALALADSPRPPAPPANPAAPAPGGEAAEEPGGPAVDDLDLHPIPGPAQEKLGHDITINLPAGYIFFDAPQARKLWDRLGNIADDSLLGLVVPASTGEGDEEGGKWLVAISYFEEGYVKDDEKLDANAILESLREGTEEANKLRTERGFKAVHVDGWAEVPRYERQNHRLVWGVKGSGEDGQVVNFNTRILGRRGVTSLNLIAAPEEIAPAKPHVVTLLAATQFDPGARYEDFQPKTDKVAEFGLAALVAGGAGAAAVKLVKVGLLAKFGAVILKFLAVGWKFILLALVAMGGLFRKLLGGRSGATATDDTSASDKPSPPADPSP